MKEKMSDEKKAKLIYSGELIFFGVVFLTLGILKITNVLKTSSTFHTIFNWVTILGGSWIIIDFLWANISSKRKQRVCILDKCLTLPAGLFLITFDILCFANNDISTNENVWRYAVSGLFIYLSLIYLFQGFYHYKHPTPELLEAIREDEEEKAKEQQRKDEELLNKENEQPSSGVENQEDK